MIILIWRNYGRVQRKSKNKTMGRKVLKGKIKEEGMFIFKEINRR